MNSEAFKQLLVLMDISAKLTKCAVKNCKASMMKVQQNKEVQKLKLLAATTLDPKKKMEYAKKIVYNKDIINYDQCLYKQCHDVYMKMIDVLIETFQKFLKSNAIKANVAEILKHLNEIKKLSKKKNLSVTDINNIQKNKNLLLMTIMTNKGGR